MVQWPLRVMVLGAAWVWLAPPAWAYFPDDHVWDTHYQSGAEWRLTKARKPLPWISMSAWNRGLADYPMGAWIQPHTARPARLLPGGYMPLPDAWSQPRWEGMPLNVPWWQPTSALMSNQAYLQAVSDSSRNPFSNQRLNADLAAAAAHGDVNQVRALIANGADLNARDAEGYTALTWAAQFGRAPVVEYLLARHAQPNVVDRWGYTPLMWALQQGHTPTAALLLSRGANPSVSTAFGITPMVLATHVAGGVSRGVLEDALAGRAIRLEDYFRNGLTVVPAPQPVVAPPASYVPAAPPVAPGYAMPPGSAGATPPQAAPVAAVSPAWSPAAPPNPDVARRNDGVLEPEPLALGETQTFSARHAGVIEPLRAAAEMKWRSGQGRQPVRISEDEGWQRVGTIAGHFGTTYHALLLELHQGRAAAGAAEGAWDGDPELLLGKSLNGLFARAQRTRDLKATRDQFERLKEQVAVHTRFQPHLLALDETLRAMGR
ncbi:MAG: ankyrin repeat domain-containing protein [Candidatus Sericytochromatia bacterium]|nr:ankyrin repeat domain-containing protein [Candidatus Sericytochromatia bacterium]